MRLYADYVLTASGDIVTLTPTDGKLISMYTDSKVAWVQKTIEEAITLNTAGYTSGRMYDIFISFDYTDTPVLSTVIWASETARTTERDTIDGIKLLTTDNTYRYLTTGRYNGSTMLLPSQNPNGELFFGTGDPRNNTSDPFTGVGMTAAGVTFGSYVWQFFAAVAGVVGVGFNSAGQLLAGAGAVVLDAAGIGIVASTAKGSTRAYKFVTSAAAGLSGFYAYTTAVINYAEIALESITGKNSSLTMNTNAPTGKTSSIGFYTMVNGTIDCTLDLDVNGVRVLTGDFITSNNTTLGDSPADTLTVNATPAGLIVAGTYTPTLTNTTNVAASTSASCNYMRVGNQVNVTGRIAIDPTAAVATVLEISLPIASNIGGAADIGGVGACSAVASNGATIDGNAANNTANLSYIAIDLSNRVWTFTFMYEVI
jgi:hypothetical protein